MLDLFNLTTAQFETFLLVMIRCSVILFMIPVFNAPQIPRVLRISFALVFSYVIFRTVPTIAPLDGIYGLFVGIVSQALIGFVFGYVAYLVFMGVQFAGEILDLQIGFAVSNILNPITQQQITVIGELELALATLIFLMTNSHLLLLEGLGGSFTVLPLPFATTSFALVHSIVADFSQAVLIVFKIAAPVSLALFIVNIALGLMSRVAPQMNVFVVGFPLQIGVGMLVLVLTIPLLGYALPAAFAQVPGQLDTVLREMVPAR